MGGSKRASENSTSDRRTGGAANQPVNDSSQPDYGAGVADRRVVPDRRLAPGAGSTGLERRRGPGRRRTDFTRAAEEGEMTGEQFLFLMAIDVFKRVNGKTFPSWSDVLEIIRRLGYRKVQESQISVPQAEDWTEPADAPLWPQPHLGPEAEEGPESLDDAA